jgi:alpha-tubulin suppressor-like RCC1 family protein
VRANRSVNGYVYAWGSNVRGQLGVGDFRTRYAPTIVDLRDENSKRVVVVQIAAGQFHSLALSSQKQPPPLTCAGDGNVYAWGWHNVGQLGLCVPNTMDAFGRCKALPETVRDITTKVTNPTRIETVARVVAIAAGALHSLAATREGDLFAWGSNTYGQVRRPL